jgi:hypothetical protein
LGLAKLAPDLRLIDLLGVLSGSLDVLEVSNQHANGLNMLTELLVDAESLIEELILLLLSDLSQFNAVIVVKTVDVVHDTGLIGLYSSQNEQVLEVLVAGEVRVVEHDALKQLNELVGHVSIHESLDGGRNLIGVLGLRESCLHYLIDNLLAVGVVLSQHVGPELGALALDQVASLHAIEVVAVSDLNEFLVARAPSALVGDESKIRVALLAVAADHLAVVVRVVDQERLRVLVNVNVNDR